MRTLAYIVMALLSVLVVISQFHTYLGIDLQHPPFIIKILTLALFCAALVHILLDLKKGETLFAPTIYYRQKSPKRFWLAIILQAVASITLAVWIIIDILSGNG